MTDTATTSRRSFLKSGAIVAVPIAAVAVPAVAMASTGAGDGSKGKLARIESERAVEDLHRSWMRRAAGGNAAQLARPVSALRLDPLGEAPAIELAENGASAILRQTCIVELDQDVEGDCTLLQMARLQGNKLGTVEEKRTVQARYEDRAGTGWRLRSVELI